MKKNLTELGEEHVGLGACGYSTAGFALGALHTAHELGQSPSNLALASVAG